MFDAALTCPRRSSPERIQRSVTRSLLKTFEKARCNAQSTTRGRSEGRKDFCRGRRVVGCLKYAYENLNVSIRTQKKALQTRREICLQVWQANWQVTGSRRILVASHSTPSLNYHSKEFITEYRRCRKKLPERLVLLNLLGFSCALQTFDQDCSVKLIWHKPPATPL